VVYVTAYDAAAFCAWIDRRLPTEAEWRYIAYGADGSRYPWGHSSPGRGQVNGTVEGRDSFSLVPAAAASFRRGESRDGVEQLLGNAQEWTATRVRTVPRVTRLEGAWNGHDLTQGLLILGGGWADPVPAANDSPNYGDPTNADDETGFRCVATK
jgi:formylglycine-generating enzyme required for sulfatase activity